MEGARHSLESTLKDAEARRCEEVERLQHELAAAKVTPTEYFQQFAVVVTADCSLAVAAVQRGGTATSIEVLEDISRGSRRMGVCERATIHG